MASELDAAAVRQWCAVTVDVLTAHRAEIDALNVYPVPDGDTGTNMMYTVRAAEGALVAGGDSHIGPGAGETLATLARGAVLGARGNSGVILSQLLRGLADALSSEQRIDATGLRMALRVAAEKAYEAVAEPVEGTILTVASAAATAAAECAPAADLTATVRAAVTGATTALAATREQLPALRRAGVVDAGGRGLVLVLQALRAVVAGDPVDAVPPVALGPTVAGPPGLGAVRSAGFGVGAASGPVPAAPPQAVARESGSPGFGYEVQYLLDATEGAVAGLRRRLGELGDSIAIVDAGEGVWNVHVHVNDIGAAMEAGIEAGRPHRISVQRFADAIAGHGGGEPGPAQERVVGSAVVAVAPGPGLMQLFTAAGVAVVDGGPGASPSTADVLAAVRATRAGEVVLLPNSAHLAGVANAVAAEARSEGIEVAVVPTRSPVQGLAAVAVHDPARRFGDVVIAMAETAAATAWAEVTVAVRDALTIAGACRSGDVLGLINGEVVEIGHDVATVSRRVLDRLLGVGGELVTFVVGADAPDELGTQLSAYVAERGPLLEVAVYSGGQPGYPLLIGLE